MCGRYNFDTADEIVNMRELLSLISSDIKESETAKLLNYANKEIAPGSIAPVLTSPTQIQELKWGLDKWDNKGLIFNARSEGALDTKMFKKFVNGGECVIPASNYFEWQKVDRTTKVKYRINVSNMFFAGLYSYKEQNPKFVILTKDAQEEISFIHNRMPVILSKDMVIPYLLGELNIFELSHINNYILSFEQAN